MDGASLGRNATAKIWREAKQGREGIYTSIFLLALAREAQLKGRTAGQVSANAQPNGSKQARG